MPALVGQQIVTIPDATGKTAVQVTWFFNPNGVLNTVPWTDEIGTVWPIGSISLFPLRNNPIDWTDDSGTLWGAGSGACIAANMTSQIVHVNVMISDLVADPTGLTKIVARSIRLPAGTGRTFSRLQLANATPPDGPYNWAQDFNGLTFDLSAGQS
jgi:hypothetical protein